MIAVPPRVEQEEDSTVTGDAGDEVRPKIDTTVPHSARIWNYWLGGKDNYPVDRLAGEQTIAVLPEIVEIARASRLFLARVVRYLAADAGNRQFLDIGTGLPTVNNTHEVAQQAVEPGRPDALHPAQPGADRRVLRGPGAGRPGPGALPAVAPRPAGRGQRQRHGRVLCPRPQVSRPADRSRFAPCVIELADNGPSPS